ncbi:hypothetical protein [uncultured Pseudodesulfovibrio sp.]|uniref:hypothetical protein n=1 Tax=uncultured Pseudodesulfovibrio sp. TaxID=2035858 RepID=UPI0029C689B3|nr:hypothetical protein [uncultured Pseudodesulfovibrio sp.]
MTHRGFPMNSRLMQYAVKNLVLKSAPSSQGGTEPLQDFYRDVCSLRLPPGEVPVEVRLPHSLKQYISPAHTAFRDLTPFGDGRFLGIEVYGRRIVAISCEHGIQSLPVEYDAFALTDTPDGFACIATNQQLTVLSGDLIIERSRSLKDFGINANGATRITAAADRYVVVVPETRNVFFVDEDLQLRNNVRLPHGSIVHDVVGYNGGVLLTESVVSCNESGALLWVSEQGEMISVFEGLERPFGISVYQECVLVCDFRGLHFLHADGLVVSGHQCISWDAFAQKVHARSGYIYESIVQSDTVTTIVRLSSGGVSANTNFCLCEFDLNHIL